MTQNYSIDVYKRQDALRALAAAMRTWDEKPAITTPEYLEQNLTYIGITGMIAVSYTHL